MKFTDVMLAAVLTGLFLALPVSAQRRTALEPSQSLAQLQLDEGFTAKILAHEPQAIDPVEVVFDDAGRMWVVEMRDYPFRTAEQPRGRIVVLSDKDADGHYETAHTFADQLEMPNGLALWKQGVVATVAGKLVYLPDADGDLRADSMQVWLEGFKEDNEQLRANHPRLGPDGLWYIACGLRGGQVQLGQDLHSGSTSPPLDIGSRDVRFNLRTKSFELITGPAQFGLAFDAQGHRLFCSNRNPATQVIFEQPDLLNNPLAGLAPSVVDVIPAGDASQVFPLVNAWTTSHLHSGQFTAACGVFVRTAGELQAEVFACEPTGCLVRRQLSQLEGPRLVPAPHVSHAADSQREWLASRDDWFRPVNVGLAPDGQVVVVDMHRAVIEHPRWVPEELKQRPDERWGDDAGRVYWIGDDPSRLSGILRDLQARPLGGRESTELVELVGSNNAWLRTTATRLLLEREARDMVAPLLQLTHNGKLPVAARIDALRLAANLAELSDSPGQPVPLEKYLSADLSDSAHRALAVVALKMARDNPALVAMHEQLLLDLATQTLHTSLRFEAWLALGGLATAGQTTIPTAVIDAATHAWADEADRYLLMAVASGLRNHPQLLLNSWLEAVRRSQSLPPQAQEQVAEIARNLIQAALRNDSLTAEHGQQLLQFIATPSSHPVTAGQQAAQLAGLVCAEQLVKSEAFKSLLTDAHWEQISSLCRDAQLAMDNRIAAIQLLRHSPRASDVAGLEQLVRANTLPQLSGPLISVWATVGGQAADQYLLDSLPGASPQLQRIILPLLAANPRRLQLLVERLESQQVKLRQLGSAELTKLVAKATGTTKERLQTQLSQISNSNRAAVVESYKDCLKFAADPQRGQELFRKHCASCHRIGSIGVEVGPNISDSRTKQPLEILTAILDPNLAIDNNYFRFTVLTEDGRVVEGIIAEETADALVIHGQDNRRERIRRDEIAEMQAAGVSLMPEGIESQIDPQAMADLIAFVKGWRYLDGAIPAR